MSCKRYTHIWPTGRGRGVGSSRHRRSRTPSSARRPKLSRVGGGACGGTAWTHHTGAKWLFECAKAPSRGHQGAMQAQTRVWAAHTAPVMRPTPARWARNTQGAYRVHQAGASTAPHRRQCDTARTRLQRLLVYGRTRNGGDVQP